MNLKLVEAWKKTPNCSSVKKNKIIVYITNNPKQEIKLNTCFDDASGCPVVLITKAWRCYGLNYTFISTTKLFSHPLTVIIAKLNVYTTAILLRYHDNAILISLRFSLLVSLRKCFYHHHTPHFSADKLMNQRL